jgi:hypothetical protein
MAEHIANALDRAPSVEHPICERMSKQIKASSPRSLIEANAL